MKSTFKKTKQPCKYWKECQDYRRSKDVCNGNEVYCFTFKNLNKKENAN